MSCHSIRHTLAICILTLVTAAGLVACGGSDASPPDTDAQTTESSRAAASSHSGPAAGVSIFGTYAVNVNGQIRSMHIAPVPGNSSALGGYVSRVDGSGNHIQDPLSGHFARDSSEVVLLRQSGTDSSTYTEVLVGRFSSSGPSIDGTAHRLSSPSDFTSSSTDVGFSASRQLARPFAPPVPRLPPPPNPAVPDVKGVWALNANGYGLNLAIEWIGRSVVTGFLGSPPGTTSDIVKGHYTDTNGRFAFVRLTNDEPTQVFIGSVSARSAIDHAIAGTFYPLTAAAGASRSTAGFAWQAVRRPVYTLKHQASEDRCLTFRTSTGRLNLAACNGSIGQRFAIEERPPQAGSNTSRLAIQVSEVGSCLGADQPQVHSRVSWKPCDYTALWTFASVWVPQAPRDFVYLVHGSNLCLGADHLREPPLNIAWLQSCGGAAANDPIWRLERLPF